MHGSKYEFEYACNRKGVAAMVPVVMEPACKDTTTWEGVVGGKLGSRLYVDGSVDEAFDPSVIQIIDALKGLDVKPSKGRRRMSSRASRSNKSSRKGSQQHRLESVTVESQSA